MYKLYSKQDDNNYIELEAEELDEARAEAIDVLGYYIVEAEE